MIDSLVSSIFWATLVVVDVFISIKLALMYRKDFDRRKLIGKNLVPRLVCYSLFFLGILVVEAVIISVQFYSTGNVPNLALFYLIATNGIAFVLFLGEGLLLRRKNRTIKNGN